DNFAAAGPSYGTDGPGATTYAFATAVNGVDSGLFALNTDDASFAAGAPITLYLSADGTTITGSTAASAGAIAAGNTYFTITVDNDPSSATFGTVTFARTQNVWHGDAADHDDAATLQLAPGTLVLEQTVTDQDGDSA